MQVSFNAAAMNNRQTFKALPIAKITRNDAEASMFLTDVALGIYKKAGNEADLIKAIKSTPPKELGVLSYLGEVAERWGIKVPSKV